jgi:hypothetical protein
MKQRKERYSSCPWSTTARDYFEVETLKKTILATEDDGRLHTCHSNDTFLCSGFLGYAEKALEHGIESLNMGRIGIK